MTTMRRLLLAALLSPLSLPSPAHAAMIEAASRVTEATIYTDRAMVTRTTRVHVPAGPHTISLTDMPAGLNEATLRVQGKATAQVKIGTVELKREFLSELANAAEREKTAQIQAKTDQLAFLNGEIEAIKTKQDFIERVATNGPDKHEPNNTSKLDFTPDQWTKAWGLLQTGMGETQKDLATKTIAQRNLNSEIEKLQQELGQIRGQQAKERRDARVNVEASAETDLDLTLTYQTSGASWRPVYDARLETNGGALQLEQYGQVTQITGEEWKNISLTLSTAQPATGSEMPRMNEWWVRVFQPFARMNTFAGAEARIAEKSMKVQSAMPAMMTADSLAIPAAPAPMEAEQVMAQAVTTDYSAEFKVPGTVDLKSTRDLTKLYLGVVKMKAQLAVQTSPRLGTQAYLFAKATNSESYPLIPGMVSKYRDGAFIGNANLPLVRPDETANFSFGNDDRVKVEYKRIKEKQDNPTLIVVGDVTVERQYQTKVQNLHKDPITITVFDQYPVAADADVKVSFLDDETTPGYAKDTENRPGVITWSGSYNPKEEKAFTLSFRVKYPKDKTVQGL